MIDGTAPIYDSYAPIYDAIGQDRFGIAMAQWTLRWLSDHGVAARRVLDLACGSGAATLVFAAAGHEVVGVERSAAMLDIARGKARRAGYAITFVQGDIRAVEPEVENQAQATGDQEGTTGSELSDAWDRDVPGAKFDLATCFYDSLNYLTGDDDLTLVFAGVARRLRLGGHLIFDMNAEAEYQTWDERDVVTYDSRDYLVYNRLDYDARSRLATGRIVWFVREIERWWRGEETHTQRAWADEEVRAALECAGFTLAARVGPDGAAAGSDTSRVVYVARRSRS